VSIAKAYGKLKEIRVRDTNVFMLVKQSFIQPTPNMIYPLTIIALIVFVACGMEAVNKINNSL
jgi:hypothetical protein